MVQQRSNVPTTSHTVGEENAPGSGNGTGGIGSTPDALQVMFGLGVTMEQLQAAIAALFALGGNVPGTGAGRGMLRSPQHRMLARRCPSGVGRGRTSATNVATVRPELRRQRSLTKGYLDSLVRLPSQTPGRDQGPVLPAQFADGDPVHSEGYVDSATGEVSAVVDQGLQRNDGPQDHLSKFYASMEAAAAPNEVKCKCFLATLEGSPCDWFNWLPKGTIDDWDTLAEKFLTHFAANRRQRLPYSHLLSICIRKGEKIRDSIVQWEKEARDVHGVDDQALVVMFQAALPRGETRMKPEDIQWDLSMEETLAQRKKWKHMAFVAKVKQAPAPKLGRREQIQFTEKDLPIEPSPHRNALVVKIEINNAIVHRTLVDTGSSVNIMYEKTFQDLGLDRKDLRPVCTPLSGFTGDSIEAEGVITVPVIVGDGAHKAKLKMEFMVQPIGALLRSANAPSRMSKWAVFLGAFQIKFKPRPAIKGQTLADFVVECTAREESSPEPETDDWWTVFTDGSSAAKNKGGGVVVIAPEGFRAYCLVRFGFKASNNETEYEALLCRLRLAAGMNATKLRIKCDSKLVIPRAENAEADILSKLSSDTPEHIRRMASVEELSEPSIHAFLVAMICARPRDWTDDIVAFLKDGALPDDAIKAKLIRTRAPGYTLEGEKL
ncbi:unnamed protein product [Cuscuta campestris]|uniref:Uncharacterized protein n=1 Tax=Cuscuta campestris TaxID=132261 RepID=A0A484K232_9ASTE|nr:unnamed protein product [Cuscuta campestris]